MTPVRARLSGAHACGQVRPPPNVVHLGFTWLFLDTFLLGSRLFLDTLRRADTHCDSQLHLAGSLTFAWRNSRRFGELRAFEVSQALHYRGPGSTVYVRTRQLLSNNVSPISSRARVVAPTRKSA